MSGKPATQLTPRQHEVLRYVIRGRTNKEIASELGVSERAIKYHVSRLLSAFDVHSRAELIAHVLGLTPSTK